MKLAILCLCLVSTACAVPFQYLPHFPGSRQQQPPVQPFSSYGFIKYSIPQPPGRQSLEIFYPYDFSQQRPLTPIFLFSLQKPITDAKAVPSQEPLQPLLQNQPTQESQV
uniref:Secretory calcium-binding phosphoprotein 5 n=1 Tax=Oryzias melastigma TaxID=30732 RepID=A0A3B3BPH3_ORYME